MNISSNKLKYLTFFVFVVLIMTLFVSKILPFQVKVFLLIFTLVLSITEYLLLLKVKKKLNSRGLVVHLLVLILTLGSLGYLELKFRNLVSGINRVEETYFVDIVSLKDVTITDVNVLKNAKVGILSDAQSEVGSITPIKFAQENKLDLQLEKYATYLDAIRALIEQKVEYIVLPEGYQDTFASIEELKNEIGLLHTNYQISGVRTIVVENKSSEVLNMVLIGGDNPIQGNNTSGFNYDVVVVLSMNFKTHESKILSIPRDSYIYLTCTQKNDKITHSGWYGADCLTESLSEFLNIEIHNYMLVDFKGLIKLVDGFGGIWIDVDTTIEEQDEDRNFDNLIRIEPGYQKLNGQEALAYLRHRKTLSTGAIARSEHHQIFITAVIKQLGTAESLLRVGTIFDALKDSVLTNLSNDDIYFYYQKAADTVSQFGATSLLPESISLNGHGELIYTPSFGINLYYYVLDSDSIKAAQYAFQDLQKSE